MYFYDIFSPPKLKKKLNVNFPSVSNYNYTMKIAIWYKDAPSHLYERVRPSVGPMGRNAFS